VTTTEPAGAPRQVDGAPLTAPLIASLPVAPELEDTLGGKGAWLNRLVRHGFAVPPTQIVTTSAYAGVLSDTRIARLLDSIPIERTDGAGPTADEIDAAFLVAEIPDEVRDAIRAAAEGLVGPDDGRLAVRSSASAEDRAGSSFAGQYRSVLDVVAADAERAVRLVWASLWHPSPRAYRAAQGIADPDLAMAVVLMRQVPADQAGVVFTQDPDGTDTIHVEGVTGLGEQLGSGAVTPWVCRIPRGPGTSAVGEVGQPAGAPPATGALARRVAEVALAVEAAFGEPQDIEWATADDDLFVLQARPITSIGHRDDGCETVAEATQRWTTAGLVEMLPGTLAPLVWHLNRRFVDEALRQHFDRLHVLPSDIDELGGFLGRFHGRAALRLDVMQSVAGAVPGGQRDEVERQYFGIAAGERPVAPRPRWRGWRGVRHDILLARDRRESEIEAATIIESAADVVATEPDPGSLDDHALRALRARLVDLGGRAVAAEIAVAASAVAAYRRLELLLLRRLDDRAASRWAQRLTSGIAGSVAPIAPAARASRSVFAGATWEEAGLAPAAPPTATDGEVRRTEAAWEELITTMRSQPGWASTRALTGQVVDVRLLVLRRFVEEANDLLARREATKAAVLQLGGCVRRVHLEIGRRLAERGSLAAATDVDWLTDRELIGTDPFPSPAEVARRRRWLAGQEERTIPQRWTGAPPAVEPAASPGRVLHGWAAAPGRHTGRARVLTSPIGADIGEGDVVVAPATDASWAPVFLQAGAIVVEQGGPLSHAAIVARELGIPAVLNVDGAVQRLGDGSRRVTVDGDQGVVVVLDGDGSTVAGPDEDLSSERHDAR
jgi:pyruvate,water dikinase